MAKPSAVLLVLIVLWHEDGGRTPVGLRDDPEFNTGCGVIDGEQSEPLFERELILACVFLAEIAPIASLVPANSGQ